MAKKRIYRKVREENIMYGEKLIFYGMGVHAKNILNKCNVPIRQIEAIIDNSPESIRKLLNGSGIRIYTWNEFVKCDIPSNCRIVISSFIHRDEMRRQILESGLFRPDQVEYIDEWFVNISGGALGSGCNAKKLRTMNA